MFARWHRSGISKNTRVLCVQRNFRVPLPEMISFCCMVAKGCRQYKTKIMQSNFAHRDQRLSPNSLSLGNRNSMYFFVFLCLCSDMSQNSNAAKPGNLGTALPLFNDLCFNKQIKKDFRRLHINLRWDLERAWLDSPKNLVPPDPTEFVL